MFKSALTVLVFTFFLQPHVGIASDEAWRDFVFYGNGVQYRTGSVQARLAEEYNLPKKPGIVILATSNQKNGNYKEQWRVVDDINHETNMFLSVIANSNNEMTSTGSYHTDTKTAKKLLDDNDFRVIVIDRQGSLGEDCNCVLSESELLRAME